MIDVRSYAEKAFDAVARNEAALARAEAQLVQHDNLLPEGDDAEAKYLWTRTRRDLEDRVTAASEALDFAKAAAAKRAAEEAEREKDRAHAAAMKLTAAHRKTVLEVIATSEKLAEKVAEMEELRRKIAGANADRGMRAQIVDGEEELRKQPAHKVPASTTPELCWVDEAGHVVNDQILVADANSHTGKSWIPNPAAKEKAWVEVERIPAHEEPGVMPARLAETIRLVDLRGGQIWPTK